MHAYPILFLDFKLNDNNNDDDDDDDDDDDNDDGGGGGSDDDDHKISCHFLEKLKIKLRPVMT